MLVFTCFNCFSVINPWLLCHIKAADRWQCFTVLYVHVLRSETEYKKLITLTVVVQVHADKTVLDCSNTIQIIQVCACETSWCLSQRTVIFSVLRPWLCSPRIYSSVLEEPQMSRRVSFPFTHICDLFFKNKLHNYRYQNVSTFLYSCFSSLPFFII